MASQQSRSRAAAPKDRPPAEQVARENYKREFGTTKPDASFPSAEETLGPDQEPALAPPVGDINPEKES